MKICINNLAVSDENFFPFKAKDCKKKMLYLIQRIEQIQHEQQNIKINNINSLTHIRHFNTNLNEVKVWKTA